MVQPETTTATTINGQTCQQAPLFHKVQQQQQPQLLNGISWSMMHSNSIPMPTTEAVTTPVLMEQHQQQQQPLVFFLHEDEQWLMNFAAWKVFQKIHGRRYSNLLLSSVSSSTLQSNEEQQHKQQQKLATWVQTQRQLFNMGQMQDYQKKLWLEEEEEEKIVGGDSFSWNHSSHPVQGGRKRQKLDAAVNQQHKQCIVEFVDDNDKEWFEHFVTLKKFRQAYGHCNVVPILLSEARFYVWVICQRLIYTAGHMRKDRKVLLDEIGFVWSTTTEMTTTTEEHFWDAKTENAVGAETIPTTTTTEAATPAIRQKAKDYDDEKVLPIHTVLANFRKNNVETEIATVAAAVPAVRQEVKDDGKQIVPIHMLLDNFRKNNVETKTMTTEAVTSAIQQQQQQAKDDEEQMISIHTLVDNFRKNNTETDITAEMATRAIPQAKDDDEQIVPIHTLVDNFRKHNAETETTTTTATTEEVTAAIQQKAKDDEEQIISIHTLVENFRR